MLMFGKEVVFLVAAGQYVSEEIEDFLAGEFVEEAFWHLGDR